MVYQGIYTGQFTVEHAKYGLSANYVSTLLNGAHYRGWLCLWWGRWHRGHRAPSRRVERQLDRQHRGRAPSATACSASSTLSLNFQAQNLASSEFLNISPTPPTVIIEPDVTQAQPADPFSLNASGNPVPLRADELARVVLSPDLTKSDGFLVPSISNGDGKIESTLRGILERPRRHLPEFKRSPAVQLDLAQRREYHRRWLDYDPRWLPVIHCV